MRYYFFVIVLVLLLDAIWITANQQMYKIMYSGVQKSPMQVNIPAAVIAYTFIFVIIAFISIPWAAKSSRKTLATAIKTSGLLGLCVYGIYNFTNLALFANYSWLVAIIDTLWGATLFTIITYAYFFFSESLKLLHI